VKDDAAARHRAAFTAMLKALGMKDFDVFETFLHADVVCSWPYSPMPGFPETMTGARTIRQCFERDMGAFTPYNYSIQSICSAEDPNVVIAEYMSGSTFTPRNVRYSNKYLGIATFRDGKIVHWREYVNPLPILDVVGGAQNWSQTEGRTPAKDS